jgi:competence protein ComFC
MRCIVCERFSWSLICKNCQKTLLQPSIFRRDLEGLPVISFYQYEDISDLILTKDSYLGFYIFQILAKNSFKKFSQSFQYRQKVHSIGIDERTKNRGYSQTAILSKSLKSDLIAPKYNALISNSDVKYLGKSSAFRRKNKRDFQFKREKLKYKKVILVDDVITTGTTLREAKKVISKKGFQPILALTLATTEKPK